MGCEVTDQIQIDVTNIAIDLAQPDTVRICLGETVDVNAIVSPNYIGALRMASEMIRPAVVDFLDSMLRSSRGNLRIHEISITDDSSLVDKNIVDAGLKQKYELLVLGIRNKNREVEFNPPPTRALVSGETLIVMGEVENISRVRHKF